MDSIVERKRKDGSTSFEAQHLRDGKPSTPLRRQPSQRKVSGMQRMVTVELDLEVGNRVAIGIASYHCVGARRELAKLSSGCKGARADEHKSVVTAAVDGIDLREIDHIRPFNKIRN